MIEKACCCYTLLGFSKYKDITLYFDTDRINHEKVKVYLIPKNKSIKKAQHKEDQDDTQSPNDSTQPQDDTHD